MQEDFIPRSGGAVISGTTLKRTTDNDILALNGGSQSFKSGGGVELYGMYEPFNPGMVRFVPAISETFTIMDLRPNGTWTWTGQPCQTASDQRLKQQISEIDDKLLDAWEDVNLVQFKYNDAVNEKGNAARLHTGYVVQQIDDACKSHNIDISEYGLYCHEEYPQETEEVEVKQDDGTIKKETKVIREASEHYSLRYTETLVVECAYLRRENARLKERLSKIEKLLNI